MYLINTSILTFYGGEVCPFLETISSLHLFYIIFSIYLLGWIVRGLVLKFMLDNDEDPSYPKYVLVLDGALNISIGFFITFWNMANYQFPLESGLKVVLGCCTLGFYSSIFNYLKLKHCVLSQYIKNNKTLDLLKGKNFISIAHKLFIFFLIIGLFTASILLLLIYKDFEYVISSKLHGRYFNFRWIIQEVLFVFAIMLIGVTIVTKEYSKNLKLLFSSQLLILKNIQSGNLDLLMPIITRDEMGLIAQHTNEMIQGLKEKKKIKETFGKYIDESLANKILNNVDNIKLGGSKTEVCVLFTDIRNFTEISEKLSPEILLKLLNEYFTMLVSVIHNYSGVLDKFIGDATMCVFGLDNDENMAELALKASIDIQQKLEFFNQKLIEDGYCPFITGIGVHKGLAIVGNIGSQQRMEYTVIGDVVNTASRIEGKTKEIDSSILISEDVYCELGSESKKNTSKCGEFEIRGKSKKVTLFSVQQSK